MLAVLINCLAVIVGSLIGLVFKKGLPQKYADAIMTGIALCVIYIGISGALKGENALITIGAIVLGALIGTALDIDGALKKLGDRAEAKLKGEGIANGFVTASLIFCIGAMAVLGSIEAGLSHNYETLYVKSMLDGITSIMLSATMGVGVMLAAVPVLIYQGFFALLAGVIAPYLTDSALNELICAGSLLIVAIGLNMLGITKIKVADYLPAIIIAPILALIFL